MTSDTNEPQVERKPVQVELVIKRDEKKPSVFQKLKRWCVIGLAGGALFAAVGSLVARTFLTHFPNEVSPKCEAFVETALSQALRKMLLVQGGLLAGGFLIFFLIAMFWPKSDPE